MILLQKLELVGLVQLQQLLLLLQLLHEAHRLLFEFIRCPVTDIDMNITVTLSIALFSIVNVVHLL